MIAMPGSVLSIFTTGDATEELFPARSVTITVPATAVPSSVRTSGLAGTLVAAPERLSCEVKGIDTLVLFQPAALLGGLGGSKVRLGIVLSMLMSSMVAVAVLPEVSVQVALRDCPVPSVLTI